MAVPVTHLNLTTAFWALDPAEFTFPLVFIVKLAVNPKSLSLDKTLLTLLDASELSKAVAPLDGVNPVMLTLIDFPDLATISSTILLSLSKLLVFTLADLELK